MLLLLLLLTKRDSTVWSTYETIHPSTSPFLYELTRSGAPKNLLDKYEKSA